MDTSEIAKVLELSEALRRQLHHIMLDLPSVMACPACDVYKILDKFEDDTQYMLDHPELTGWSAHIVPRGTPCGVHRENSSDREDKA